MNDDKINLTQIRTRLNSEKGPKYWKSIQELTESEAFLDAVRKQYPTQTALLGDALDRRKFMKIMGASFALAGLTACGVSAPEEKIVPYVKAPEEIIPGKPLFFATAMTMGGLAKGLLVESNMGRPTKIEGNPDHPASLGATDAFAQASVLSLYDPDRSQAVRYFGEIRPWEAFLKDLRAYLVPLKQRQGTGIRILTENVSSPTLGAQIQALQKDFPQAKWHQYEPINRDSAFEAAKTAFGGAVDTIYKFDKANVVFSLESDFLMSGGGSVRYTRDFMSKRKMRVGKKDMNRLYVVESMPSNTGAVSDHRLPVKSSEVQLFARAVAAAVGISAGPAPTLDATKTKWVESLAKDLKALENKGKSIVIAGDNQPAIVHALAHAINQTLGNVGETVVYIDPVGVNPVNNLESLKQLVQEMDAGQVELLLILGGNPVYTSPMDFHFGESLKKVKYCVHLSQYYDETSELAHWHIPETHFLEAWSDARAFDGTANVIQPLIAPLHQETKSAHEMLTLFTDQFNQSPYDVVRSYWKTQKTSGDFEAYWRKSVHDGIIPDTARQPKTVALQMDKVTAAVTAQPLPVSKGSELVLAPDPSLFDGRFANNGWLQELPKPITKLTWDNAVLMSYETAQRLGVSNEDLVELNFGGKKLSKIPVWVVPGHASDCFTVHLGFGRTRVGHVGNEVGVNAYTVRTSTAMWGGPDATITNLGEKYPLACTQEHFDMRGSEIDDQRDRKLIRDGTLDTYLKKPDFALEEVDKSKEPLTLFGEDHPYNSYAWGMAVDTSICTGCNACVVACVSENNGPVVGKEEVRRGREMQWIRIDQYYTGEMTNPEIRVQPVMCQQCEAAPCEVVCPVNATAHSTEGINEMAYNRCIGTKYCSNNCPYKVRRFNFFAYQDFDTPLIQLGRNPNVTVRSRGVMEKCTFCVQRVNAARIEAELQNRPIQDGEVVTACQGACPAEAIVFGNINDPKSKVARLKAEPTNYGLLAELNVRPRTSYLATIRNPNSELHTQHKTETKAE